MSAWWGRTDRLHREVPSAHRYGVAMPASLAHAGVDIGIVTSDIDSALHFYRDLLGFRPLMVLPTEFGDLHLLIAGEILVKLADVPDANAGPKGEIPEATGVRYLTFWVSNLDELLAELEAAEVTVLREPFEVVPGAMAFLVHDPDGNVVEFLEQR